MDSNNLTIEIRCRKLKHDLQETDICCSNSKNFTKFYQLTSNFYKNLTLWLISSWKQIANNYYIISNFQSLIKLLKQLNGNSHWLYARLSITLNLGKLLWNGNFIPINSNEYP